MSSARAILAASALMLVAMPVEAGVLNLRAVRVSSDRNVIRYPKEYAGQAQVTIKPLTADAEAAARKFSNQILYVGGAVPNQPLHVSQGSYPMIDQPGSMTDGSMPLENIRAATAGCIAGPVESLGSDADGSYALVRLHCKDRPADWANPILGMTIKNGAVVDADINIGDLPTVQLMSN